MTPGLLGARSPMWSFRPGGSVWREHGIRVHGRVPGTSIGRVVLVARHRTDSGPSSGGALLYS